MFNVVPLQTKPQRILTLVRQIAQDSSRVFISRTAEEAMARDGVTMRQVLRCMAEGSISQGPYYDEYGLTCLELERVTAGRLVRVVASIEGRAPSQRVLHVLHAEEL